MKFIIVFVLGFLLSGCDKVIVNTDHQKTFDWAVNFCGGRGNIQSFDTYETRSDNVQCTNGQSIDIPVK